MGLYLAIFEGDNELDGVEVGSYADFSAFRSAIATHLEGGVPGSRYPILMLHSDCDGQWSSEDSAGLAAELMAITGVFMDLPAEPLGEGWKAELAKSLGLRPSNLYDCFFDVDGEPLLDRFMGLARLSIEGGLPILFQ